MCCLLEQKERREKAINLLGSHRCLEVLVPQNHQENPEERRQTWVLVTDIPWCKGNQPKNCSPCNQYSTLVDSGSQGSVGQPACFSSSKPFLLHQHIRSARSSTRPKALIHCSLLGPMKGNQKYCLQGSAMSCTWTNGSLERKNQWADRKAFSLAMLWKAPNAEAAGHDLFTPCLAGYVQATISRAFLSTSCQPWAHFMRQARLLQRHVERQRECA